MYTDATLTPIYSASPYTAANGTQYPANYPKADIAGLYPVTESARPNDVLYEATGFTINAQHVQVWTTRTRTAQEKATTLLSALAAHRYSVETGGIMVGGIKVSTDRELLPLLEQLNRDAIADSNFTTYWTNVTEAALLTAPQIIAIAEAVKAHYRKCFNTQAQLIANVANYASAAEIKAAFDASVGI